MYEAQNESLIKVIIKTTYVKRFTQEQNTIGDTFQNIFTIYFSKVKI